MRKKSIKKIKTKTGEFWRKFVRPTILKYHDERLMPLIDELVENGEPTTFVTNEDLPPGRWSIQFDRMNPNEKVIRAIFKKHRLTRIRSCWCLNAIDNRDYLTCEFTKIERT